MQSINTIDLTYENQAVKVGFLAALEALYDSNMLQGDGDLEVLREN